MIFSSLKRLRFIQASPSLQDTMKSHISHGSSYERTVRSRRVALRFTRHVVMRERFAFGNMKPVAEPAISSCSNAQTLPIVGGAFT